MYHPQGFLFTKKVQVMTKQDYSEQLRDKRWKLKRLDILRRDGFKCQICGYFGDRVNVHHLKYTGMAWDAPDNDLITLCRECHNKLHTDKWPVGKSLAELIALYYGEEIH